MFEEGKITPHSFVDTCFGLEHNGGRYFDKWWNTSGINVVLDLNQEGFYCYLYEHGSNMVRQVIPVSKIKELCLCGSHSGE